MSFGNALRGMSGSAWKSKMGASSGTPMSGSPSSTDPGSYGNFGFDPVTVSRRNLSRGFNPTQQATLDRGSANLGELGDLFGQGVITRRDVPQLEAGLNYQNYQLAEQDRERAYNEMVRGRSAVGTSLPASVAREVAMQRVRGGGGAGAAIRGSGALAAEDLRRGVDQGFAARGISGAAPVLGRMEAERALATDIAERAALADAEQGRADLALLSSIASQEEAARAGFDQMIAALFRDTERQPFDFSGLLENVPNPNAAIFGRQR